MISITDIQKERGSTYGRWQDNADIAQRLTRVIDDYAKTSGENMLHPPQREAIEMCFRKIARIINGDPYHLDSWIDAESYLNLGRKWTEENPR